MAQFIRGALFLFALNLAEGNIPGIGPRLCHLSGFTLTLLWAFSHLPLTLPRAGSHPMLLGALPVSILLLISGWSFPAGMALLVYSLFLLSPEENRPLRHELSVSLLTLLFYGTYRILHTFSPHAWYLVQHLSLGLSPILSELAGEKMTLGPSALGIPVMVTVICRLLAHFFSPVYDTAGKTTRNSADGAPQAPLPLFRKDNIRFLLLSTVGIAAAMVLYLGLTAPLSKLVLYFQKTWKPTPFSFQALLPVLLWGVVFLAGRKNPPSDLFHEQAGVMPEEKGILRRIPGPVKRIALPLLSCLIVITLCLSSPGVVKEGRVVFLKRGSNWSLPSYSARFGQAGMGMFGLLPEYLKTRGYRTALLEGPVTGETLRDTSILAIFNPKTKFTPEEKRLIHDFVKQGGGLVVAGDHTDVSGVMKPINDLIEPFNIVLEFDTALPLTSGWVNCLEKRPHAITRPLDHDYETSIWVGASLGVKLPAEPVIVGKRGWADLGDYANVKRAFLGDYRRGPEEQLGDLVLAAHSPHGRGKVLVFGDTSTFQSGVLTANHHFINGIFDWLNKKRVPRPAGLRISIALVLICAGALFVGGRLSPAGALAWIMILGLGPGAIMQGAGNHAQAVPARSESKVYQTALIDISHHGRFSLSASADGSIFGLGINLMRNRYLPLYLREFSPEALGRSDLLFVIAPSSAFTPKEAATLTRYMENGGTIFWCAGWEEADASRSFLDPLGLSVDSIPLGRGTVDAGRYKAEFLEAWPVTGGSEEAAVLARKFDYPVILHQPVGKGGLILIGDSEFLHSRNLESYRDDYRLNNIRFFRYLLNTATNPQPKSGS